MIRLEVVEGQEGSRVLESSDEVIRLGRSDLNDLVVGEWHVSGEHASIVRAGEAYVVRDHHSTNGTRILRGDVVLRRRPTAAREAELGEGDILMLGDAERPIRIGVSFGEEPDDARIVSLRKVDELAAVEATVGADRDVLQRLYEAQKAIGACARSRRGHRRRSSAQVFRSCRAPPT